MIRGRNDITRAVPSSVPMDHLPPLQITASAVGLFSEKIREVEINIMATENLKKINLPLQLKQVRREGRALLEGQEKTDFGRINEKFDYQRVRTEQLYRHEYKTRVEIAHRVLMNRAGAKTPELKPRFFGIDRFNKFDLNRQAQLNVRFDHQQSMDRLDSQELKESKTFLEKSSQRKKYLADHKQATERRRTQYRRESPERRRSQSMSD